VAFFITSLGASAKTSDVLVSYQGTTLVGPLRIKEYLGFTGCGKLKLLKGTAFRPYVTTVESMRL
jgi:hypothetical protein